MAASTPVRGEFAVLDRLIERSLGTLRLARAACARTPSSSNVDARDRAEENLNALLEFRCAAQRRPPPSPPSRHSDTQHRLPA
jgi:hypothetical protein